MDKNKYYLAVAVMALLITTAGVSAMVSADEGTADKSCAEVCKERRHDMKENRGEMKEIFANKDFEAWQSLMAEKPNKGDLEINEETFAKLSEMYELMQSGDKDGVKAIADELGLPDKPRGPKGNFDRPEMREAIESGDYSAWKDLVGDREIGEQITEENFAQFVEMHNLMKSGDREGAEQIREELGLEDRALGAKKGPREARSFNQ